MLSRAGRVETRGIGECIAAPAVLQCAYWLEAFWEKRKLGASARERHNIRRCTTEVRFANTPIWLGMVFLQPTTTDEVNCPHLIVSFAGK